MSRINESELVQLVAEAGPALVLFARQWTSNPDDALQEGLIELATKDPAPVNPKAWLFQVVRNKAKNLARSERRRAKHESVAAMQACWFEPNLEGEVDGKMVSRWIERLPDLQRQVVVARIWGELTFQQIADLVDRPTATVFRYYRESLESIRLEMNQSDGRIA